MNKALTRKLVVLVLAIVVSVSAIVGGTYAWFTDTVESNGNIIKAGILDAALSYKEKLSDENWIDASTGAIFNYNLWEPGYTDLKYVKVENKGSLAFEYQLNILLAQKYVASSETVDTNAPKLEDVIDVYYAFVEDEQNFTTPTKFADITAAESGWMNAGTITSLMANETGAANGVMLPAGKDPSEIENAVAGDVTLAIALHMQESAGNEYQNLSVGEGFAVQLLATQYTYEEDSFGSNYDENATYSNIPVAYVRTLEEMPTVSGTYKLNGNGDSVLSTAYAFHTTESAEAASKSDYAKWHADFVVTFDKDIEAGKIGLAGMYPAWAEGAWIGIDINEALVSKLGANNVIKANTPIRLLGSAAQAVASTTINIPYESLCAGVVEFQCGAYEITAGAGAGITMNVDLCLFENANDTANDNLEGETENYITIGTYSYTFPSNN